MQTIEQQRAANALSRVEELKNRPDEFKKRYRAYVDRLGPTIVMNGLGQALATESAAAGPALKKEDERAQAHRALYANLQGWLCRSDRGVYPADEDILHAITKNDEQRYLHAQAEALAWLEWHKKCCRAEFPAGEDE